jgi:methyltransferase family protein
MANIVRLQSKESHRLSFDSPLTADSPYGLAHPGSLPTRVARHQRRKMFETFASRFGIGVTDTVLDVGVTSDRTHDHSNYLEAWWPRKDQITAVGVQNASFLESRYPGLRFVQADGCRLPFKDEAFEFVHSSAVLEHVGNRRRQIDFIRELVRVARCGIFITTPNRWFPIEVHTMVPLLHWLPQPLFRRILTAAGQTFFSAEENLNLLTPHELAAAARAAGLQNFLVSSIALFGLPSNLLLLAQK